MVLMRTPMTRWLGIGLIGLLIVGLVAWAARASGNFHLRLLCESVCECGLISLTLWAWLGTSRVLPRVLAVLSGIALIMVAARFGLVDRFASWVEVAMHYVPVVSLMCVLLRGFGGTLVISPPQRHGFSFSIRWLMAATLLVAILFPLIRGIVDARQAGQFGAYGWLLDTLIVVVPVSLFAVASVWALLVNRLVYVAAIVLAAPLIGVAICQIYKWDYYQSIVIPTTLNVWLVTLIGWTVRRCGYAIVRVVRTEPPVVATVLIDGV